MKRPLLIVAAVAVLLCAGVAAAFALSASLIYPKAPVLKIVGCKWGDGTTSKTVTKPHPWTVNLLNAGTKRLRFRETAGTLNVALPGLGVRPNEDVGFKFGGSGTATIKTCSGTLVLKLTVR